MSNKLKRNNQNQNTNKKKRGVYTFAGIALLTAVIVISVTTVMSRRNTDADSGTDAVASATAVQNTNENMTEGAIPTTSTDSEVNGIFSRSTTRLYSDKTVEEELINTIIQAAFASPSGGGQYANEYIVVDDREVMKQMMEGNPYAQALETAPVVIVIAGNVNNAYYEELLMFDAGIAAQSIMVEASELGLSSVPMSIAPTPARLEGVAKALNLPDGVEAQMMIAIGYPLSDAYTSASVTYYNEAEVHYNTWE